MRWKIVIAGLALTFAATVGCKQQIFMTECDIDHYRDLGVDYLETNPSAAYTPPTSDTPPPATVLDPGREIRHISLTEAMALALENGTIGVQSPFFPGAINDLLVSFAGRAAIGSDSIRVLALQPAITANDIDGALSKFDARWINNLTWTTTDQPVGTFLQAVQASGQQDIQLNQTSLTSSFVKPLATGGAAAMSFGNNLIAGSNTIYQLSNPPQPVNPAWTPSVTFSFEQPLLQGYGVEINQLRAAHPGSVLIPFTASGRAEGIVISRIRFDEQRAEFERTLNFMILNVEIAYWNLYGSYWTLYSREQALRQAFEAWKINKARHEAGRIPIQDFAQTRQQYELFRGQRIAALGDVLEKERQLRGLLGLTVEDGTRLVPSDTPTLAPYKPDWSSALNETLALRPELVIARNDLKFRQLDLIAQKNTLLPDMRFVSQYGYTGLGTTLDGPGANNALRSLSSLKYGNWVLGLQGNMPFGFRDAHAAVRTARLNLAQSYAVLQDQETKSMRYLVFQYRRLFETYEQIKAQRAQREAAALQLEARFKEFLAGRGTLDILLEAQRVWADSLRAEYDNIVLYNNALAGFEFAKGTILQHNNIAISEGPLPQCAQVRAVEHERRRSLGFTLREHENPMGQGNENGGTDAPELPTFTPALPVLPAGQAVKSLTEDWPAQPEAKEKAPMPLPVGPVKHPQPADAAAKSPINTTSKGPAPAKQGAVEAGPTLIRTSATSVQPVQPTTGGTKPAALPSATSSKPTAKPATVETNPTFFQNSTTTTTPAQTKAPYSSGQ